MTRPTIVAAAALFAATPTLAAAQQPLNGQVQRLFACRSIADSAQRLQCFDRESATAAAAVARRDLVFIDRERVKVVRKDRFGFNPPDFGGLFGNNDKDDVTQVESTIVSATEGDNGALVVHLADKSVWRKMDDVLIGAARPGQKVVVTRAMMGAYRMKIAGLVAFKAKRIR